MNLKEFFSAGPGRAFVIIALVICAATFYVGRGMGYDTGRAVAAMSANSAAEAKYQEGYDAGKEEGHDAGYKEGVQATRENYEAKLEAEYSKGYNAGEAKGHAEGYEDGRKDAYAEMNGIEAEDQYLAGEAPYTSSDPIDPNSYQVYYTIRAGEKYHTRICGHLKGHEWNNMSLAEAWSKHYEPCADCDPPSREDVYGS